MLPGVQYNFKLQYSLNEIGYRFITLNVLEEFSPHCTHDIKLYTDFNSLSTSTTRPVHTMCHTGVWSISNSGCTFCGRQSPHPPPPPPPLYLLPVWLVACCLNLCIYFLVENKCLHLRHEV